MRKRSTELAQGDQYIYWTYGTDGEMGVTVTIIGELEFYLDALDREMFQYMARREDTGKTGYVRFGDCEIDLIAKADE